MCHPPGVAMIESRGVFKAVPLNVLSDLAKANYILDRLVEHDTEWSDFQGTGRRELAAAHLARHYTDPTVCVLEVWRMDGAMDLCGLLGFSDIVRGVDAQFHPIFFDGRLRNAAGKRDLLLRTVDWAFRAWDLHRVSLTIPETAFALLDFARKKLGFRFEGERRIIKQRRAVEHGHHRKSLRWQTVTPTSREAEWGSRRYQALLKNGVWHDVLLLSLTRDEFADFVREATWDSSTAPLPSKPSPET